MTSSNIEKYSALYQENLDPNNYTVSLLNEALRLGLIDQETMHGVQAQAMTILGELTRKYTKGESSSLRVETTQRLLMSIFYAIDAGINNFDDVRDALAALTSDDLTEIYKQGLDSLESNLEACRQLYQEIDKNKLAVHNEAYQATINDLPKFFRNYDILFNAQDTMANIDYPLLFDDMSVQGILYIKQYLEKLNLENQICQSFASEDIDQLLYNYSRVYRINVHEALINILEIVLSNAIFSILSGNSGNQLHIAPEHFELLHRKLSNLDRNQLSSVLVEAIETLISDLHIEEPVTKEYIRNFKGVLLPRFMNALEYDCLHNIIIFDTKVNQHPAILFDEGNSLDDKRFRLIVEDIMDCARAEDKAAIIRSEIHSLGDFIDILEAECLFGDEFHALYNSLGDMELSILARIVFIEDIRTRHMNFSLANPQEITGEMEWQVEFCNYIQNLNPQRIKLIENYIKSKLQINEVWDFLG